MGTTTLLTLYRLNFIPSSTACLCSVSQEHFTSFFNIPEIAMLDRKNSLNKGRSLRCWRSLTKLTKCYQRNAGVTLGSSLHYASHVCWRSVV